MGSGGAVFRAVGKGRNRASHEAWRSEPATGTRETSGDASGGLPEPDRAFIVSLEAETLAQEIIVERKCANFRKPAEG
jgi:hypothetical protein